MYHTEVGATLSSLFLFMFMVLELYRTSLTAVIARADHEKFSDTSSCCIAHVKLFVLFFFARSMHQIRGYVRGKSTALCQIRWKFRKPLPGGLVEALTLIAAKTFMSTVAKWTNSTSA